MIRRAKLPGPLLAAAALSLSGCFRYVPTEVGAVPVGENVRVFLTREAAARLDDIPDDTGPVPALSGTLRQRDNGELMLRVPVGSRQEGFHTVSLGQDLSVPESGILAIERREIDKTATGFLVAGSAAAVATVILFIVDAVAGETPLPGDDPPELMTRLLSIPIG